ncbi:hypothetical protein EIP91_000509 [Steccherinum ochraceum]|uniref:SET domain-containing protein n=1 Tax=Steccherinum ochraceum TaxID=92696 RepID=A0A4R0RQH5_9APHY|nr:hypothetical protein EIP91_000509 [Steccherinum ochraceum]
MNAFKRFSDVSSASPSTANTALPSEAQHHSEVDPKDPYDADVSGSLTSSLTTEVVELDGDMALYPAYEVAAPLYRNIRHGDDSNDMPFIPYSNEGFNWKQHALEYKRSAWQKPKQDPDQIIIALEVARRLHNTHGISPADVDATRILPMPLCSTAMKIGVLSIPKQAQVKHLQLSPLPVDVMLPPDPGNLKQNLQNMLNLFCANASCAQSLCMSHHISQYVLPDISSHPRIICNDTSKPCSPACFAVDGPDTQPPTVWTPQDISDVKLLLSLARDAVACDLAVICRKPCREIHAYMEKADASVSALPMQGPITANSDALIAKVDPLTIKNHALLHRYRFVFTTGHATPRRNASASPRASTVSAIADVTKIVLDDGKAALVATASSQVVGIVTLTARVSRRAASAILSFACPVDLVDIHVREKPITGACHNGQLQYDCSKLVEVKESAHGLGLFVQEKVKARDLIVEYLGEMIFEATCSSRDEVAKYRGRNYVFELNAEFSLDGLTAGNESRFINHSSDRNKVNCSVAIKLVNGDHRIGVFATKNISSGSELFLDYGPHFF